MNSKRERGFIFSMDAVLALALAFILCAAIISLIVHTPTNSQLMCKEKVGDSSIVSFYLNNRSTQQTVTNGVCSNYCRYSNNSLKCFNFCEECK